MRVFGNIVRDPARRMALAGERLPQAGQPGPAPSWTVALQDVAMKNLSNSTDKAQCRAGAKFGLFLRTRR